MNPFELYLPTRYIFGPGVENRVGEEVRRAGGTRVLLHYSGGSVRRSGLLDRVQASLDKEGIGYVELAGVKPNPDMELAYEGIDLAREEGVDFIVALGGGSAIDSAKAIALGVKYDGDVWDYYSGKAQATDALPVGTIPTLPAAGSEGSPSSVMNLTAEDGTVYKRGTGSELIVPRFALENPELTHTLPVEQTAAGIADIFTHTCERYFTKTRDVYLTDLWCEAIMKTLIKFGPIAIKDPENSVAREQIMWASTVAHNDITGIGREQDWASHSIEHELSALYDVAHGAGLAVVNPAWMRYVYKEDVARFVRFATEVFGMANDPWHPETTALEGIKALKAFYRSIGLPVTFKELGGKEEDIPKLISTIGIGEDGLGSFKKLHNADIEAIYSLMKEEDELV